MIIYKLTFANGKSYIGQTMRTVEERVREHRKASNRLPVSRAWRLHGEPVIEVIGHYGDVDALNAAEIAAIAEHQTIRPNGYNICEGGHPHPMAVPEVVAKVSAKLKGRVFCDATRAKMSASAKSRVRKPWSAETRAKMSESARKAHARDGSRGESIRAAHAARSPEERSEAARKAWATKRAKELTNG